METNEIYYFTGTGNCLAAAKQIAEGLGGGTLTKITRALALTKRVIKADRVIIIYPSYAYGCPEPLYAFIKNSDFDCKHLTFVVTCGSKYGASLAHAKRLIKKKNIPLVLYYGVKTVENYLPLFGMQKEEKIIKNTLNQTEKTNILIDKIKNGEANKINSFLPFHDLISFIFRKATPFLNRFLKATDKCTSCGICAKACPAAAITVKKESKAQFDRKKCAHCQCCINICPEKAVTFLKMKKQPLRYRHQNITINELLE